MSKVIVIGAGMVGSAMAIDMIKNHEVTLESLQGDHLYLWQKYRWLKTVSFNSFNDFNFFKDSVQIATLP